jgi:hypothetical protein
LFERFCSFELFADIVSAKGDQKANNVAFKRNPASMAAINSSQRGAMRKQLLVRNLPEDVRQWIEKERQKRISHQEFVLSPLQGASSLTPQTLPLPFEQIRTGASAGDLPFTSIDLFAGIGG